MRTTPDGRHGAARLGAFALTLAAACGGPASTGAPTKPALASAPSASPDTDFSSEPVATLRSPRFELDLPLPDGSAWRVDDRTTSWLVARHGESQSTLLVRAWREGDRMNRSACEASARLTRDLPAREGLDILERRAIGIPEGFDTELDLAVAQGAPGEPLTGVVLAFGGWAHKCFAFVFTTRAAGARAEELLGRRLANIVQRSLGRLTFENELTPAIPRAPAQ